MLDSGGRKMFEYKRAESPSDFIMEAIDTNALGYKKWEPNFKLITHSPQPAERYSLFTDNEKMNDEIECQKLNKILQEVKDAEVHAKHRREEAQEQEGLTEWLKDYSNRPVDNIKDCLGNTYEIKNDTIGNIYATDKYGIKHKVEKDFLGKVKTDVFGSPVVKNPFKNLIPDADRKAVRQEEDPEPLAMWQKEMKDGTLLVGTRNEYKITGKKTHVHYCQDQVLLTLEDMKGRERHPQKIVFKENNVIDIQPHISPSPVVEKRTVRDTYLGRVSPVYENPKGFLENLANLCFCYYEN